MILDSTSVMLPKSLNDKYGIAIDPNTNTLAATCLQSKKVVTVVLNTSNLSSLREGDYKIIQNSCPAKNGKGNCEIKDGKKCII